MRGWLATDTKPLGAELGQKIDKVDSFTDDAGNTVYYIVYLRPSGFVIVSADDLVEPIIGFVSKGGYDPSLSNPLGALVSGDLPNRIAAARSLGASAKRGTQKSNHSNNREAFQKASLKAQDKWAQFSSSEPQLLGVSSISDVWVEPLTQSTWGQTTVGDYIGGITCYNHYTPYHYPIGCVAAGMAQLMRYYEYGGSYVWSNMPLQPSISSITLTQRQAIGSLCYDIAESVNTIYGPSGSSAYLIDGDEALTGTFGYSNSIYCDNFPSSLSTSVLKRMSNPNIDAGYPVIFGISNSTHNYGHAIICDGYGYNALTLYHHLNMGWSGNNNAWYNLPTINTSGGGDYDVIDVCIYNVFVSDGGEIISGRVTSPGGNPISDVNITATGGGGTFSDTTNANGIYALVHVPSNTSFTVTASKNGWDFSSNGTSTGKSVDEINKTGSPGNRWGINFTGTISAGIVEFDKEVYRPGETITIILVDSDIAGSGSMSVLVTTSGGIIGDEETVLLSESPAGSGAFTGSIATAQAWISQGDGTIQIDFGDTITVTYNDADDGTGNPATAQDTANTPTMLLETDFTGGLPAGWSIIDGGSSSHTWTSTNLCSRSNANWSGTFMIVDSDCAGPGIYMDEQLITPNLDCSSLEDVTLEFTHYLWHYYVSDEIGVVDVRVDSGPWQNVARYQGDEFSGPVELDISSIADGQENVQIRWHYYNATWGHYWGIDNVQVIGLSQPPAKCSIEGYKFDDTNGNGVWDQGESGLAGWLIYLDSNDNGQREVDEPNAITDPNGYYEFLDLEPGTYIVAEVIQAGWTQTLPGGNGTYTIIAQAGHVYQDNDFGNMAGDISAEVTLDNLWMYQNLPGKTASNLTATVSVTDDPMDNNSHSYEWEFILPTDVTLEPIIIGPNDTNSLTFAARGCDQAGGLSDLGQALTVRVTVTGNDYGNTGTAEAQFGVALLGDVNNDGIVNLKDRQMANDFWQIGPATGLELRDCDVNCDNVVNLKDRSITNDVWQGEIGQNSVTNPCPLR